MNRRKFFPCLLTPALAFIPFSLDTITFRRGEMWKPYARQLVWPEHIGKFGNPLKGLTPWPKEMTGVLREVDYKVVK